jgi:hypothetical protein
MDTLFCNEANNDLAQLISSFCLGVLFSPWSWGLVYYIAFLLIYEILSAYYTWCQLPYWRLSTRLGVIAASLLGFILGRILVGYNNPLRQETSKLNL